MDDIELTGLLTQALSLSEPDRKRLTKDMQHRRDEAERDALLWQVIRQAVEGFHQQVATIRTHSQALAYPGQQLS